MKRLKVIAMAAALLVALSACAASTPASTPSSKTDSQDSQLNSLIAAAKKEGKLVFYSTETDDLNNALAQGFEAKYGIPVEMIRLVSGDLESRFASEQKAGVENADLLQIVGSKIWTADSQWFVDLDKKPVPGYASFPDVAKHGTCIDMEYSVGGITYNKDLVDKKHIPTKYTDLLSPYWKGKLLLSDPRGTPAYMGWAAAVAKKYGISYLQKLAKQNLTLVDSATPGAQQVAAGAFYANVMAHLSNSTSLRQSGAPLGFVVMKDVPTGLPTCMGIAANAPHPAAARLFTAWRMTVESQNIGCEAVEVGSPLANASKCVKLPKGWKPTDLSVMDDPALQAKLLKALGI